MSEERREDEKERGEDERGEVGMSGVRMRRRG